MRHLKISSGCHSIATATLVFLISFCVRLFRIHVGNFVIWDEAHFGKFAGHHLRNEFYFDVHPPLGKILTALGGYLANQDTSFSFKPGEHYPDVFYVRMRIFHALFGAFVPVFVFLILIETEVPIFKSFFMSNFFIFEPGLIFMARIITIDTFLLFFTFKTVYFFLFVKNRRLNGHLPLLFLGTSIGNMISVKWVGCLTAGFIGTNVFFMLYSALKREKIGNFLKKFCKCFFYLGLVPTAVYASWFYVHFRTLNKTSHDNRHVPSFFKFLLESNENKSIAKYIYYGTPITIKEIGGWGGNLHSKGFKQPGFDNLEVHLNFYSDGNDYWVFFKGNKYGSIKVDEMNTNKKVVNNETNNKMNMKKKDQCRNTNMNKMNTSEYESNNKSHEYENNNKNYQNKNVNEYEEAHRRLNKNVNNGNIVHIYHFYNNKFLCWDGNVVKCGDFSDRCEWKIIIFKDDFKNEDSLKTATTRFKIFNVDGRCYLSSKEIIENGIKKRSVVCSESDNEGSQWRIENNETSSYNPQPYSELFSLKKTFLHHFLHLNKEMFAVNNALRQHNDLEPKRMTSKPYEWPLLIRGVRVVSWKNDNLKFYMFGNPFSWYVCLFCIVNSPIIFLIKTRAQKYKKDSFIFLVAYFFHYVPFFFIKRILYFHHYYTAHVFAMLFMCKVLENNKTLYFIVALSVVCFFIYSKLCFGFLKGELSGGLQVLKTWDFV